MSTFNTLVSLNEAQLQKVAGGKGGKCSAKEANKAMLSGFASGAFVGAFGGPASALGAGGASGLGAGIGYWASCWI
ncbi:MULTISPECIES: hypothetical protein [Lacticaseibacillus]|uniref:Bacteriocin n=1 Tax=Lacticaseibacillus casei DSM 20011 = JCM 1134 = ATCC 393 TaxID=1423732 RepID=A0AAD1ERU2_LACCA|nr:hypothetical protein [Lacticaseibacillus casei]MDZ5495052.1 hypothetical protein [Lacticaseibacillus casei]BAN73190.1 hypothetical protein LBCZ_0022 [Lacticaseibacillus casei DSM 20011 = JCM 1134 = ATCC 393]